MIPSITTCIKCMELCRVSYRIFCWGGGGGEDFFLLVDWPRPFVKPHPGFHTGYSFISWGGGGGMGGTLHNYSFFIGEGRIVLKTCKDLVSLGGGGGGGWVWGILPQSFFFFNLTTMS